jgi:hypothetical protein
MVRGDEFNDLSQQRLPKNTTIPQNFPSKKKCPKQGHFFGAFDNERDRFQRVGRSVADDHLLFSHCAPFAKYPIPSLDKMGNIFWNQSIFQ